MQDNLTSNNARFSVRFIFIAMTALLVIALAAYLLWSRQSEMKAASENHSEEIEDEHSQEGMVEIDDETAELIGLKTEKAMRGQIEETLTTVAKALVAPNSEAIIGSKTDGRATSAFVEPGQNIKAGQTLIIIDSPQVADLRGQLIEAEARLKLAEQNRARMEKIENRASLIQSKNRLDLAASSLERKRRLAELGAASGREVAEAEVEYKNAKAEYEYLSGIQFTREQQQAESEVEQSRAVVARLTSSLAALGADRTGKGGLINITSPISGTIIDRHVSIGQAVTAGAELMTVMNLSSVIIEAQLPESLALRVEKGQRLVARLAGLTDRSFEGRIESVGNSVDKEKRTVAVRARITNAAAILKHEMAVEARIVTGASREGLLVPLSAIVDDEGLKVVYVREGERCERRVVTVGIINHQWAEILSGIEEGEEVVTAGAYQIKNFRKGEGEHHDDH
ncbi:MAG: efflux RND transporter periplasmic adaptor subunit [Acidobacteriota bacterium]